MHKRTGHLNPANFLLLRDGSQRRIFYQHDHVCRQTLAAKMRARFTPKWATSPGRSYNKYYVLLSGLSPQIWRRPALTIDYARSNTSLSIKTNTALTNSLDTREFIRVISSKILNVQQSTLANSSRFTSQRTTFTKNTISWERVPLTTFQFFYNSHFSFFL